MFTSVDLLQTIILSDTFKVPDNQIGGVIANIQLIDYGVRLATAIFFGHIVDMFGRKIVFFYSILSVSAGYALIPLQSSIYPGYLLSKLLASQGIIAL
jgi:MFS family permease